MYGLPNGMTANDLEWVWRFENIGHGPSTVAECDKRQSSCSLLLITFSYSGHGQIL